MELLIFIVAGSILLAPAVLSILALARSDRGRRERSALSARVDELERRISRPGAPGYVPRAEPEGGPEPAAAPAAGAAAPPSGEPAEQAAAPPRPERAPGPPVSPGLFRGYRALDVEALIGGRVLNRIGILAMLIAAAFFLKWAFDNAWIGPAGRLALGFLGGAALMVYSQLLFRRDLRYFAEGIAALGAGVLYLTLYAGRHFYDLIPEPAAFGGMVAVTLGFAILAIGRDSQRLAFLAFLGGYLTPLLLSTGRDAQVELFTYLAVVNGGVMVAALTRRWRWLEPLAFAWTVLYFAGWYDRFYDDARVGLTCFFALLFFGEFLAAQVLRGRWVGRLEPEQIGLVLANAGGLLLAMQVMLYRDHRWALTVAVLALSAVHLLLLRLLPVGEGRSVPRLLMAVLALTFVTLAIPIRLQGAWIAVAWAVEGILLVGAGFRSREGLLRGAGLAVFALVPVRLLDHPIGAERALLNPRLGSFLLIAGCLLAAFLLSRRNRAALRGSEPKIFAVVGITANVLLLWALSMEVWDFAGGLTAAVDDRLARQLGLSLLWTVYATCLLGAGVRRGVAALRWQGLILLGATVLKVFLHDLSFLERGYRILSFVVLGGILLAVSFLYQRFRVGQAGERGG